MGILERGAATSYFVHVRTGEARRRTVRASWLLLPLVVVSVGLISMAALVAAKKLPACPIRHGFGHHQLRRQEWRFIAVPCFPI